MKTLGLDLRLQLLAAALAAGAAAARGQSTLLVLDHDKLVPVVAVARGTPLIEEEGRLVHAASGRYLLQPAPEFMPVFVAVRNLRVSTYHLNVLNDGRELNHEFRLTAQFESAYHLDQVFIALEIILQKGEHRIFVQEVGDLYPRTTRTLTLQIPMDEGIGPFRYEFHVFTRGREVLQSLIPPEVRERILDVMVANRIENAPDGPPRLFVAPPPEYPPSLPGPHGPGSAVMKFRIDERGAVQDASVKSATNPAFGLSALEAIRLWRFLPRIKDGHPAEMTAVMPIAFGP